MVWDVVRDSTFGHLVRLASKGKYFQYAEERDPSLLKEFIHEEKSSNLRHHGNINPPGRGSEPHDSESSSRTQLPEEENTHSQHGESHRTSVDPEKGRDTNVIDWYGSNDPDNPRNWSTAKKFFVTFEICFLTFSVYIGSAIYTAGIQDVVRVFGVSQVAATLGLTLYALFIWVVVIVTRPNSFTGTSRVMDWAPWSGLQ